MSTLTVQPPLPPIDYPDSDGMPMAENTLQYQWIVTIVTGLRHLFEDDPNVFVAGDLFWYPVEGHPEIRLAPDAMVAFGRPRGDRGSYRQWEEGGVAPQVVFEVLSPGNRPGEMAAKLEFYARHGVQEYYIVDPGPGRPRLAGFLRQQDRLIEIKRMSGHVSARLGIRFEQSEDELTLFRPDGEPFMPAEEIARLREQERQRADQEHDRAEKAVSRAKHADDRAKQERDRAKYADDRAKHADDRAKEADDRAKQERDRANQERDRANQERDRADRLQRELDQLRRNSANAEPGGAQE